MPANAETPGLVDQPAASSGAVGSILGNIGSIIGVTLGGLLKTYGDGEVAKLQAKNDIEVQKLYTDNARQNYGTNDPADAARQAKEQTMLLFGFLPVPTAAAPIVGLMVGVIGIVLVVGIIRLIRK